MVYANLTDMLLDNREGLRQELMRDKATTKVIKAAMTAFDWVSMQYLRDSELLNVYREQFGEIKNPEVLDRIVKGDKSYVLAAMKDEYPDYGYAAEEARLSVGDE